MLELLHRKNDLYQSIPFQQLKTEEFLPALQEAIQTAKKEIQAIIDNPEKATWKNTILALEYAGEDVGLVSSIFFNLNSAETNDEIQKLAREFSPLLSEYSNDIALNEELFNRVKYVFDHKDNLVLSREAERLLEKNYKGFVRNGALLNSEQKEQLRSIDKELSTLSLQFGENLLAENNKYKLIISNKEDLAGLPESTIEAASETAEQNGESGKWVFTLDYPSYIPFMMYAENRSLREELYRAFTSKAFKGDELDNQENIKRIVELRLQRAQLLGYKSHSHFILEERMAKSADVTTSFLQNILDAALPKAKEELKELEEFAKSEGAELPLQRWDVSFYAEKLKQKLFNINDEMLKPYFQLEKVIDGVFQVAHKLYGLQFYKEDQVEVYHKDVQAYRVENDEGDYIGLFYADFFPRAGKRQGAWMTSYKSQFIREGVNHRPHISNVCNFTKPTSKTPSLLTFNEVTTLFHEFGHALHGLLSNCHYESMSGTNVYWDFVELPSQVLENWCYEKECLDLFAKHYETGEAIPQDFIEKIKASANFQSGMQALRQVGFGLLDMKWHSIEKFDASIDVSDFEKAATEKTDLFPKVDGANFSAAFAHIFQGGYSSGYYSYKWAEVLDADAFEYFTETGIFNKETGRSFMENILSAGSSEHPEVLYERFRGRKPSVDALLKREGLK